MRFLHTADWHLGRVFHGYHLTEDQGHILKQLETMLDEFKPDLYIIAGDIYDRTIPPTEAVELLNDHLSKVVLDLQIPVILIAGNHDNGKRLSFGSKILCNHNCYIVGDITKNPEPIILKDDFGQVSFYAIPYLSLESQKNLFPDSEIKSHQMGFQYLLESIKKNFSLDERRVAIGHGFVQGGIISDSERPLSVGGSDQITPSLFEPFHYTALGHLHGSQYVGKSKKIRYSGSLLKYSLSEIDHEKSASLVEMDEKGECTLQELPLIPKKNLRKLEGYLEDILKGPKENFEDYLAITLFDQGALYDVINRLRKVYPHIIHLSRKKINVSQKKSSFSDYRKQNEIELFKSFYEFVQEDPLPKKEEEYFQHVLEKMKKEEEQK